MRNTRAKRIRFTDAWDVILLKCVVSSRAHVAEHGSSQKKFEETLGLFLNNSPKQKLDAVTPPTWKTIYERFKKVVADHRASARKSQAASGVAEDETERTQLLDDILQEMDDSAEQRRAERCEKSQKDKEIVEAGELIRAQAVGDVESQQPVEVDADEGRLNTTTQTQSRKRYRRDAFDSEEGDSEMIHIHMESRRVSEAKRTRMEEERLEFDKIQSERRLKVEEQQASLSERRLELDERRIALDEKRMGVEAEDRKGQMEERKQVLSVLGALITKLN